MVSLLVNQEQPGGTEVVIHDPTFDAVADSTLDVCYVTMWESTALPAGAVDNLNKAKVVVVPSEWQAGLFAAQGVVAPIEVVPMGVDPARFPFEYHERPAKAFTFGVAGNFAVGGCRKNVGTVIDAFEALQKNTDREIRLVIKVYPDDKLPEIQNTSIEVVQKFVSKQEIANFYRQIDCFVSATRGEGWGLMQHEAMLSGVPVIAPTFGGLGSFLDSSTGYPVAYGLVRAAERYADCGMWADPNPFDLLSQMQQVLHGKDTYSRVRAARARAEQLSWDNSNCLLEDVLTQYDFI
tara:strand:- start:393 stop:1274 length:882 start_codon:yes stop_codon:yes gene_type:complete